MGLKNWEATWFCSSGFILFWCILLHRFTFKSVLGWFKAMIWRKPRQNLISYYLKLLRKWVYTTQNETHCNLLPNTFMASSWLNNKFQVCMLCMFTDLPQIEPIKIRRFLQCSLVKKIKMVPHAPYHQIA